MCRKSQSYLGFVDGVGVAWRASGVLRVDFFVRVDGVDYHTKELRQGFNLQRDDSGADRGADCGSLLGWRHFHELAHRLARLDFVDGYAVRVRAGDGRR